MDRILDYALWLTIRELEPYWLPEFQAGKLTFGGDAKKLAFALNAIGNKDTVKPVLALIDGGKVPKENLHGLYLLLAQIGGPEELGKVLDARQRQRTPRKATALALLAEVEDGGPDAQGAGPHRTSAKIIESAATPPTGDVGGKSCVRLIGHWKVQELRNDTRSGRFPPPKCRPPFAPRRSKGWFSSATRRRKHSSPDSATKEQPTEVRRLAIAALAGLDAPAAAKATAEFLTDAKPDEQLGDLFAAFLNRKGGASLLAKALAGKKLNADVAKIGLKAVRAVGQPADDLTAVLTKAGDIGAARKPPTDAEVKVLAADALKTGDAARGETIYRRKELQCLACHAYGGAGGLVGPDMTSIGASAQPDYLVDSLLLPHKAIKEGFDVTRVVTTDDKVLQGIKVREANGVLVLRTAEDKEVTIPLKDIAERGKSTKSLMPEGLTDQLTKQEFADLVRFLTELGKVGGHVRAEQGPPGAPVAGDRPDQREPERVPPRPRVGRRRAGQRVRVVACLLESVRRPAARGVAEVHRLERHRAAERRPLPARRDDRRGREAEVQLGRRA